MINYKKPLIGVVILFFLVSCSDDSTEFTAQNLYGTWEQSQFNPEVQLFNVNAFIFKNDGTFENRRSYRQQDVEVDLGFYFLNTGNYVLNGNKLLFSNLAYFNLPEDSDQQYVLLEDLVQFMTDEVNGDNNFQAEISINSSKNELTLDYGPCPPNALCLGPQTFFKVR
jgi:hypothetical protein